MRCQTCGLIGNGVAMTFISDQGYDVHPRGEIGGQKKPHRLNIAKNFDAS